MLLYTHQRALGSHMLLRKHQRVLGLLPFAVHGDPDKQNDARASCTGMVTPAINRIRGELGLEPVKEVPLEELRKILRR